MQLRRFVIVTAAVALAVPLVAQTPLPTDPTIRSGTLPSGLQYFLVTSAVQRDRVTVQLAVKAGSVDEADDQRGVAHLLEHMAFNGSAHFKPGEMASSFQSFGARVGAHINAATGFDSTMFFMDVPVAPDTAVRRAFEALRDVADGLTLDGDQLERERRVVIEEWRRQLGVAQRQRQPLDAALFGGSRYADRAVLGDVDGLATMPIDRIRRFYRDHYHPDRMALIVAGGLPTTTLETLVHETFDTLRPDPSQTRSVPDSPRHTGTQYAAFTDPEVRSTTVGVMFVRPHPSVRTAEDLRSELVQTIAGVLMNERLASVARRPNAPFSAAGVRRVTPLMNTDVVSFSALVTNGNATASLSALLEEIARVREHGFTDEELTRARTAAAGAFMIPPRNNRAIVDALMAHFLRDEPVPSPTQLSSAARTAMARTTNDDIRAEIRASWSEANRVITSSVPSDAAVAPVTEATLVQVVRASDSAAVPAAWHPVAPVTAAATALPPPGKVKTRREEREAGITVLTLSNGVEVWLRPNMFGGGEVVIAAMAPGGGSLATASTLVQAQLAPRLVSGAGVGGLTPAQRTQLLQGRRVSVQPFVTYRAHGINGTTRLPDLDAALNLMHLHFTAPNDDQAAFDAVKAAMRASLQAQGNDPRIVFQSRVSAVNAGNFPLLRPLTAGDVETADSAAALRFYRERFSNASNFTFFVSGMFTVDAIVPLLEKYVGSLPSTGMADTVRDPGVPAFPSSIVTDTVHKGLEPRSEVALTFFADADGDAAQEERAIATASILQARLMERLRGELGATYTVSARWASMGRGYGTIAVNFVCAPATAENVTGAAIEEAKRLNREGPTAAEVATVKAARLTEVKARMNQNGYWIDAMERARRDGREPSTLATDPDGIVTALSVDELTSAARRFLPESRYTVVTLLPEAQ